MGIDERKAIVIGGGVAGLQAALALVAGGAEVVLVEKSKELGGRLRGSHRTFPELEPPSRYLDVMLAKVESNPRIRIMTGSTATGARRNKVFDVDVRKEGRAGAETVRADALIIATGMELVNAGKITEFGLGRFPDVVTSERFEAMLSSGEGLKRVSDGSPARAIVFVQCVGSRVEKRGVPYCSAVCCSNAIKQAMLVRQSDRSVSAYILYIDIRTAGRGCEAFYKKARQEGVRFVRGQPSMILKRPDSEKLVVCGENTLAKELYEIPADLVVLSVGLELGEGTKTLLKDLGAELDGEGLPRHGAAGSTSTTIPGLFVAGCAESPKDVQAAIAQGAEAGLAAVARPAAKD
ncbi:MAG: FAD-dependent oxidoreductase [Methanomassiliicoccales archaeon]|nr:FAD-dependent oxidoreductase [Methanomassiliicoccales archaeon]